MESQSLTVRSNGGLLRVLVTPCEVSDTWNPASGTPAPKLHGCQAIWDTGATASVITDTVVASLGLQPIGVSQVHGVHGMAFADKFLVNIRLPNGVGFAGIEVTKGVLSPGHDVLIGMDIITHGDLALTNKNGTTVFTFCVPSTRCFDFVIEHNARARATSRSKGKKKR